MMAREDESCFKYIKHTLEPIVEIGSGDIRLFEMISLSAQHMRLNRKCIEAEDYADMVYLLTRQLEFFQKLNSQTVQSCHSVLINIDPGLLYEAVSWRHLIPFIFQFNIHIGIDMVSVSEGIPVPVMYAISRLRTLGVRFWICHADEQLYHISADSLTFFDGVKLGKHCFWQCFNKRDATLIKFALAIWGNHGVIVEGVENQHHRLFLKSLGLIQGQGFHWRARLTRQLGHLF